MRVLFVQAVSTIDGGERVYPLGIARLAAGLRTRYELSGLDLNLSPFPWPQAAQTLRDFRPQAVCISFRNLDPLAGSLTSFVPQLKTLTALVKAHAPEAKIIIGGSGFTLFAGRLMAEVPELDYGLAGQADQILPALLQNLGSPGAMPGLYFPGADNLEGAGMCPASDVQQLPAPDYDLFPISQYSQGNRYVAFMGVESKRGCPHNCSYCLYPVLQGRLVRLIRPVLVVDEIQRLVEQYGVGMIHFTDPVLNQPLGHLHSICIEILRRGLKVGWTGFFREDSISAEDLDLYQRAGLNAIYFSGDGASQQGLISLNKALSLEQIKDAAAISAASGLITVYHFLVNLPGENQGSVDETKGLVEDILDTHARAGNPAAMVFNNLRLYPGAPLTGRIMTGGLMDPAADLLYPVYFNPPPFDGLRHQLTALAQNPAAFSGYLPTETEPAA